IGYLCLFGVPFIFFDIYFFKSYNFIIFYSISEFYSIFNLTVPYVLIFSFYHICFFLPIMQWSYKDIGLSAG
ncbi:hypothetical protein, partial [Candidatus Bandiella numerosa]|uniref:hypothetical protein n=1 Tax=Candidatus Bandiella numerosa TaxID=2570586 RepID=UPI001F1AD65B